jgi:hypothetical protein
VTKLPQGTLDLDTAIERLARRKHPDLFVFVVERGELVEAWRELCQLIVVEKSICPRILKESGDASYEADRAQFVALQERYIFVTQQPLRGFAEKEQRFLEIERPQTSEWRDANGTIHHRSRLFFLESDWATAFGAVKKAGQAQRRKRSQPKRTLAKRLLQKMFPNGLPSKDELPPKALLAKCKGDDWKGILPDTLERAATELREAQQSDPPRG